MTISVSESKQAVDAAYAMIGDTVLVATFTINSSDLAAAL